MEQRQAPMLLRKSARQYRRDRRGAEAEYRIQRTPVRRGFLQERMILDPFPAERVHQYEDACLHDRAAFLTIASSPEPCRVRVWFSRKLSASRSGSDAANTTGFGLLSPSTKKMSCARLPNGPYVHTVLTGSSPTS